MRADLYRSLTCSSKSRMRSICRYMRSHSSRSPPSGSSGARAGWDAFARVMPTSSPIPLAPATGAHALCLDTGHLRQHLEDDVEVVAIETHGPRRRQELIAHRHGRQGHVELAPQLERQVHVFLHHVDVKPHLLGLVED